MWRNFGKREAWMWTAFACFLCFGLAAVLAQRLRTPGPLEMHAVPPPTNERLPEPKQTRSKREPSTPVADVTTTPTPVAEVAGTSSEAVPEKRSRKRAPEFGSVSINQATLDELEQLPGVGPSTAQAIVDYRLQNGPFQSLEELGNVKGIGPKKYEKLRPYVCL